MSDTSFFPRLSTDVFRDGIARHVRHADIDNECLRAFTANQFENFRAGMCGEDLMPCNAEQRRAGSCRIPIVICDQHLATR